MSKYETIYRNCRLSGQCLCCVGFLKSQPKFFWCAISAKHTENNQPFYVLQVWKVEIITHHFGSLILLPFSIVFCLRGNLEREKNMMRSCKFFFYRITCNSKFCFAFFSTNTNRSNFVESRGRKQMRQFGACMESLGSKIIILVGMISAFLMYYCALNDKY